MPNSTHHYIFTHLALRRFAFSNSVELLNTLGSPRCEGLVDQLLQDIDARLGKGVPRTFETSDIKISCVLLQNRPCAILQMPPPERTTEAYFVAIRSRYEWNALQDKAIASSPANQPLVDYFTLERGSEPTRKCHRPVYNQKQPTCFCSWDSEGTHRNFGESPSPDYEEFVQFLDRFKIPKPMDDDFPSIED